MNHIIEVVVLKDDIKSLQDKFIEIKKKGWIPSVDKGSGSIGLTLEAELGKEVENFEFPDYCGIEIKVQNKRAIAAITLFHAAPDSNFFEIKRLQENYGYPDAKMKQFKVLQVSVNTKTKTQVGEGCFFQLYVERKVKKVYLLVYDRYDQLIDYATYWTFKTLKEKLYRKLTYLAFVEAKTMMLYTIRYFKYTDIQFYKIRGFSIFLDLVESGIIQANFTIGVFYTGKRAGQIHDHGTGFKIGRADLERLFDKIK